MLKPGNLNGSRVCVIPSLGKFLQLVLRGSVACARACPWSLGPGPLGPWALGPLPLVPGPLGPCPLGPGPLSLGPWALGPWVSHPNGANGSRSRIRTVPMGRASPPTSLSAFRLVLSVSRMWLTWQPQCEGRCDERNRSKDPTCLEQSRKMGKRWMKIEK